MRRSRIFAWVYQTACVGSLITLVVALNFVAADQMTLLVLSVVLALCAIVFWLLEKRAEEVEHESEGGGR